MLADPDPIAGLAINLDKNPCNDNEIEDLLPKLDEVLYLRRGLTQPGGKLPLFDLDGQRVAAALVRRCLAAGWATPWFSNPLKPDWLVCKLTPLGRRVAEGG